MNALASAFLYDFFYKDYVVYIFLTGEFFVFVFFNVLYSALPAAPQILLCRRMVESNPGLVRLRYWQSDALTTRPDLIHD
jgi:hypothetical protein